jgi:hypothetical protein
MRVTDALDEFGASLKNRKAAEIRYVSTSSESAREELLAAVERVRTSGLQLLAAPARNAADLVLKAKALRWQCPDGVPIEQSVVLAGAEPPRPDSSFAVLAAHYILRDALALAD